jgi:hypothetical protein
MYLHFATYKKDLVVIVVLCDLAPNSAEEMYVQ